MLGPVGVGVTAHHGPFLREGGAVTLQVNLTGETETEAIGAWTDSDTLLQAVCGVGLLLAAVKGSGEVGQEAQRSEPEGLDYMDAKEGESESQTGPPMKVPDVEVHLALTGFQAVLEGSQDGQVRAVGRGLLVPHHVSTRA